MPFQLTIASGKEVGREFVFDQPEALLGRTEECDVILYEANVSRRHARLFFEAGAHFIEDLGSSNGTLVNGQLVARCRLEPGDRITLGPVNFIFDDEPKDHADKLTEAVNPADLMRSLNKGVALLPPGAGADELRRLNRRPTLLMAPPHSLPAPSAPRPTGPRRALNRRPSGPGLTSAPALLAPRASPTLVGPTPEAPAKHRPPPPKRRRWVAASVAIAVIGLAGLLGVALIIHNRPSEAHPLTAAPLPRRFGLGEGVTAPTPERARFEFAFDSDAPHIAVINFELAEVSPGELSATLNDGPPQLLDSSRALVFPPAQLTRGTNHLRLDNLHNPPQNDHWQVWNLALDLIPLAPHDDASLLSEADRAYETGLQRLQQGERAPSSLWEAHTAFRHAWVLLEVARSGRAHPTHGLARDRLETTRQALEDLCKRLLLEANVELRQAKPELAAAALERAKAAFPSQRHACWAQAEALRQSLYK